MGDVTGVQVLGFTGGASFEGGQEIAFKMKITDGNDEHEIMLFAAHDLVPEMVAKLITLASMARDERSKQNPREGKPGEMASGLTLGLVNVTSGLSLSQPGLGVIILELGTGVAGRVLALPIAVDPAALHRLAKVCSETAEELRRPTPGPKPSLDS